MLRNNLEPESQSNNEPKVSKKMGTTQAKYKKSKELVKDWDVDINSKGIQGSSEELAHPWIWPVITNLLREVCQ